MAAAVRVEGLDELVRAFGRLDRGLRRELQKHLRVIGKIVADDAKAVASEKGLRGGAGDPHEGLLIRSIRPRVRGGSAFVADTAVTTSPKYPAGYPYPKRIEFAGGGARAFLAPALDRSRERVVSELERLVDWVESDFGGGA